MAAAPSPPAEAPAPSQKRAGLQHRLLALNFLLLAGGEFAAKLLTFLAFSYLGRTLGPISYGNLEFTLAVMVFFALPADLGLGSYGAREIARNRGSASQLLREISSARLAMAVLCCAALLAFIAVIPKSPGTKALLMLYGLSLFGGPALLQWFFQAHDKMHWVALASIIRQTVFAGGLFLFFHRGTPLLYVGFFECASVAVTAAFCVFVMHARMGFSIGHLSFRTAALRHHLAEAMPIGLTELAWAFMWYFATVLLGFAFEDAALGWFGASHRMLMALHTFIWLYFFNLLPSISRSVAQPVKHLRALMNLSMSFAVWTSIFAAFTLSILARKVLTLVYGAAFDGAATCFTILVWMLPVAMISGHYRYALIAYGLQKRLLLATAAAAGVAVLLGFALVPLWRATGAAIALLAANIVNFVLVYYEVKRRIARIRFRSFLPHPLLAMLAAGAVFYGLRGVNIWLAAAVASSGYLGLLIYCEARQVASVYRVMTEREVAEE